jgi:hypothetical protein
MFGAARGAAAGWKAITTNKNTPSLTVERHIDQTISGTLQGRPTVRHTTLKGLVVAVMMLALGACVSMADLNHSARKIENVWLLEYQKMEIPLRTRVIEGSASDIYLEAKKALVDVGLPVISSDIVQGKLVARGIAPAPLSQEEWLEVVKIEGPRVKELSDGYMYMSEDPSNYILTVTVTVYGTKSKSAVLVDYELSAPRYEAMGLNMPHIAPPEAVAIGTRKFWTALSTRLAKLSKPAPRKLRTGESI